MKYIGIIGNGKIGRAVASLLRSENFKVVVADSVEGPDVVQLDGTNPEHVEKFIRDKDGIILYSPLKLKYSEAYDGLEITLNDLPYEVVEIIFTPSSISFLWNEKGGLAILNKVSETTNSIEL